MWLVEGGGHGSFTIPNTGGAQSMIGALVRVTPSGVATEFPFPMEAPSGSDLTAGSDGNIWVADGAQVSRFRLK
jgi:hypothetical protein